MEPVLRIYRDEPCVEERVKIAAEEQSITNIVLFAFGKWPNVRRLQHW